MGDLQVMAAEIFLFRGLWKFNRKLWLWSYAFHLGLYLAVCAAFCAAAAALSGPMETVLGLTFNITGVAGCALVIGGASGLMARRLRNPGLSAQTTPADIFNLGFFMATAAMLLWTKATWQCVAGTEIAKGLLTFNTTLHIPAQQTIALAMTALLILYIPLTHMAHFIAKYFTYHSVRWDDRRNGPAIEAKIAEYLTYKPTWSAAHVGASGDATWADVVTKDPVKGAMK
jgi:nitrate reductase gamma subunit